MPDWADSGAGDEGTQSENVRATVARPNSADDDDKQTIIRDSSEVRDFDSLVDDPEAIDIPDFTADPLLDNDNERATMMTLVRAEPRATARNQHGDRCSRRGASRTAAAATGFCIAALGYVGSLLSAAGRPGASCSVR